MCMQHESAQKKLNRTITRFLETIQKHKDPIDEWVIVRELGITPRQYADIKPLVTRGYSDVIEYDNGRFRWIGKAVINREVVEE